MSDIEPHYKDLNPNDYVLGARDYTSIDSYTDVKGYNLDSNVWFFNIQEIDSDAKPYMDLHHIVEYHNARDKEGIVYVGEFLRHTCPAGEYYQNLTDFAKNLTSELHMISHNEIIEAAFKYSGCNHKNEINAVKEQSMYHPSSGPYYEDLNPDDYELMPRDYTIFDNCTDTTGPYKDLNYRIWSSNFPDPKINSEPYIIFNNIMTYKNQCDKEGVIYLGEFFRYTCPAGEHYQNLSIFPKQLTNELVGSVHKYEVIDYKEEVIYAALKFSGCNNIRVVHIHQADVSLPPEKPVYYAKDFPQKPFFRSTIIPLSAVVFCKLTIIFGALYVGDYLKSQLPNKNIAEDIPHKSVFKSIVVPLSFFVSGVLALISFSICLADIFKTSKSNEDIEVK